jgi:dihydrofolate reductase
MAQGKVFLDITMSLDGFVAGPDDDVDQLHEWIYGLTSWREAHGLAGGDTDQDSNVLAESIESTGAVVMGRRWFDLGEPHWGDNPPFHVPVFVVTHRPRETVTKEGGTTYTFVTDGIESALEQARSAAGDKDISVGSANVVQQLLKKGLLDELRIHVVPLLLGEGVRLFNELGDRQMKLEKVSVLDSSSVTHLRYLVLK